MHDELVGDDLGAKVSNGARIAINSYHTILKPKQADMNSQFSIF